MTDERYGYEPNCTVPPGATIREAMARGATKLEIGDEEE